MKTPTPEEVINNVIKETGYAAYKFENILDRLSKNTLSIEVIIGFVFKAMRDYAEALYTERIEKAGSELPKNAEWMDWYLKNKIATSDTASAYTYEWMKQAASLVIANERGKHAKEIESCRNDCMDELSEYRVRTNEMLKDKDKEIEELKKDKEFFKENYLKTIAKNK